MTQVEIILLMMVAAAGVFIVWLLMRQRAPQNTPDVMGEMRQQVLERLDRITDQVDRRLAENVRAMQESKSFLADRASSTERTVREVTSTLNKLEHATAALKTSTDEISSFQNLLKSPKVRGSFGEVMLNSLLADVLPHDRYSTQHTFSSTNEIADAIIRLQDGHIVAVDAKFPLANYEAYARAENPDEKLRLRVTMVRDVKKHIADIARKYISPSERTLDYAFMYIPMEGVYYETMVQNTAGESLWEFCLAHHVVPVSPNSFLAYLQTILVGLRGMKIEQQARQILENVSQVQRDFHQFGEDFAMVGKHITNAKNRFDDSARRLDKFQNRLEQIEGSATISPSEASADTEQL